MREFIVILARVLWFLLSSPFFWGAVAGITVVSILVSWYRAAKLSALGKLMYERELSSGGIFEGETCMLYERLYNPTWFPLFFVRIDFYVPSGLTVGNIQCVEYTKVTGVFHIPPRTMIRREHVVCADRRNHYCLHSVSIDYRKESFEFDVPIELFAYPKRYGNDADIDPALYSVGEAIANRPCIEDPFFWNGIRPYHMGDPMRAINFKATVRAFCGGAMQWMSDSYESSHNYDSMIVLDLTTDTEGRGGEALLELSLRYVCFLFCRAISAGGNVGFATNCTREGERYIYLPCGRGEGHATRVLETLAEINGYSRREGTVRSILQAPEFCLAQGVDLYLITTSVDDKTAAILRGLEQGGRRVFVLNPEKGGGSI